MSWKKSLSRVLEAANPSYVARQKSFFKPKYTNTEFIGIKVPVLRSIAQELVLDVANHEHIESLLSDHRHEVRYTALLMMVELAKQQEYEQQDKMLQLYLDNVDYVSNWDLVDTSCASIVGHHLIRTHDVQLKSLSDVTVLPLWYQNLFQASNLWHVRISIVSLLALVNIKPKKPTKQKKRQQQQEEGEESDAVVAVAAEEEKKDYLEAVYFLLLQQVLRLPSTTFVLPNGDVLDDHDLIHKAIGWVLREAGKQRKELLLLFLQQHSNILPATTVRYAIERLTTTEQNKFRNILKARKANNTNNKEEMEEEKK